MAKAQSKVEKKQPQYGSDVVVDLMKAFDIEYAAFNPGATFRGIHDSIVNYGGNYKPEVIFCNHEEIAVAVAHGYAKAPGSRWPPSCTTWSACSTRAWRFSTPSRSGAGAGAGRHRPDGCTKRRRPWIDWIHTALVQGNQVRDYVKWDDQPVHPGRVPDSFIRGYRIATSRADGADLYRLRADLQEEPSSTLCPRSPTLAVCPAGGDAGESGSAPQSGGNVSQRAAPIIIARHVGRQSQNRTRG